MTVALDSNIFIYVLDDASSFSPAARSLLERLEASGAVVVASAIARTEILHRPCQLSVALGDQAKQLLDTLDFVHFLDVSPALADQAATLCAQVGSKLKNIDALHLATALDAGASEFWTNDQELSKARVKGLVVKSLRKGSGALNEDAV